MIQEKTFKIGSRTLRTGERPYVIAEIGVNHEGSMDLAKKLIELAKEGGADAAKFQTYKADKIAAKKSPAYWDTTKETTKSQHELFSKYDAFGPKEYEALAQHCKKVGIDFLSTPFDLEAVDSLDPLMPVFKVASADLTNVPLLKKIASKNKPVLLSTGASYLSEIQSAVETLTSAGVKDLILLHCILNYPCNYEDANLNMIDSLRTAFPNLILGYSDHTPPDPGMLVLISAWLKGAVVLEKHFTHDKNLPGNDHYHAMDVNDLRKFVSSVKFAHSLLGATLKEPLAGEAPARQFARRSLVTSRSLRKGETIKEQDIICKRPATGISPLCLNEVLGRTVSKDLESDHILNWSDLG